MHIAWLYLIIAIAFEIAGFTCMRLSEGLTRLWPTIGIFVFFSIAFVFVTLTIKTIDMSVAYTIWSGIGVSAVAIIGYYFFGESMTPIKIGSIVLILIGITGLKLTSSV